MGQANNQRSRGLATWSLIVALVAFPIFVFADEPEQTISDPGFRPESEHAAAFLDALGSTRFAVLPTIVRRIERTAHSFASQQQIVAYLNDSGLASAITKPRRVDLGPLRRRSQWEIFQYGSASVAETLGGYEIGTDYTLVMEILVPGNQAVFGIEVYIMDRQGRSAFSFLLNSHHEMFSQARLAADNSSEDSRAEMIEDATRVGLAALEQQIERARERGAAEAESHAVFVETPIDERSSRITLDPSDFEGLAVEKAMRLTCECAELTVDRGFRFFRIDERAELSGGRGSFRISFYESPPEGLPVADTSPGTDLTDGPDPMTAVLDAEEIVNVCRMLADRPQDLK